MIKYDVKVGPQLVVMLQAPKIDLSYQAQRLGVLTKICQTAHALHRGYRLVVDVCMARW